MAIRWGLEEFGVSGSWFLVSVLSVDGFWFLFSVLSVDGFWFLFSVLSVDGFWFLCFQCFQWMVSGSCVFSAFSAFSGWFQCFQWMVFGAITAVVVVICIKPRYKGGVGFEIVEMIGMVRG
jgi:hypothetical protein